MRGKLQLLQLLQLLESCGRARGREGVELRGRQMEGEGQRGVRRTRTGEQVENELKGCVRLE